MSLVGVPLLLAPIIGPVIGGAIVSGPSWRWIFFVNLPVGAAAMAARRDEEDRPGGDTGAGSDPGEPVQEHRDTARQQYQSPHVQTCLPP